jgi:hypothetical protein
VVEIAGGGHDQAVRLVKVAQLVEDVLAGDGLETLTAPQDGASQRMR